MKKTYVKILKILDSLKISSKINIIGSKKKLLFLLLISISFIPYSSSFKASERNSSLLLKEFTKKVGTYYLGPGDLIKVSIFNFEELSSRVSILPDGTINLPRIKTLNVGGLSLEEAKILIEKEYKSFIRTPIIYINIVETKPIKINILGEVQTPGLYSLGKSENNTLKTNSVQTGESITSKGWPTLIDSIQKAGGFTIYSDLRNIRLSRKDKKNGEIIKTEINLWHSLYNNSYFENPYIYDGDVIMVNKIESLDEAEVYSISNSSFSPSSMNINIIGSVINPGITKVRTNTRLMDAVYAAGGFGRYANRSKIKLVRMRSNGGIFKKDFKYNENLKSNNKLNPYLIDGDIIIIDNNKLNKTTNLLSDIIRPSDSILRTKMLINMFD